MSDHEPEAITIALSPTQVDDVVRAAARGRAPSISTLIADSLAEPLAGNGDSTRSSRSSRKASARRAALVRGYMPASADPRMSRSLLRGLSLLTGFGPDGEARGIVELAEELGMSPSTAHRYALTLVEVGLLERCPRTRKYRLPQI
ncbi:MAG TPA: helix-turn-helix domain-containing protein [Solirubrobacteraceae bacterium]|nr:helix-turn-helix domain-containing protein [Solirubrobacteraceae bacterium]